MLNRRWPKVVLMSYAEPDSVVGRPAYVTVAIPGGDRAGEVFLRVRGGTESYIAFADQPVEVGAQVVVLADRGARSVLVAPL
jgi:hypothetical protein